MVSHDTSMGLSAPLCSVAVYSRVHYYHVIAAAGEIGQSLGPGPQRSRSLDRQMPPVCGLISWREVCDLLVDAERDGRGGSCGALPGQPRYDTPRQPVEQSGGTCHALQASLTAVIHANLHGHR